MFRIGPQCRFYTLYSTLSHHLQAGGWKGNVAKRKGPKGRRIFEEVGRVAGQNDLFADNTLVNDATGWRHIAYACDDDNTRLRTTQTGAVLQRFCD